MGKQIWEWILRNFSNLFSLIGFVLTIYLGFYYVPDWIEDAKQEKIRNAKTEIIQSLKELVYSDSTIKLYEVRSLIMAKEIELRDTFPITAFEILVKAQESFMQDKFLPLDKRRKLVEELEKAKLGEQPRIVNTRLSKSDFYALDKLQLLSVFLTLMAVVVGIYSYYKRFRLEQNRTEELENLRDDENSFKAKVNEGHFGYEFEKSVIEVLKSIPGVVLLEIDGHNDQGYDAEFTFNGRRYIVEIKYLTRSKVGLSTLRQVIGLKGRQIAEAWLIYNTDVTNMVIEEVKKFNKENSRSPIRLIQATSLSDLRERVQQLLNMVTTS